jgi:hypothetical protein
MKWFIENCTPTNIGIALALAVIIVVCWQILNHYIDQADDQWLLDNPLPPDEQEAVDRANAEYYGLSLKARRDLAALKRVSKLS